MYKCESKSIVKGENMVVFLRCIDFSAELYINAGFPSSLPFNTAHYIWDTCSHEMKLLLGRLKLNKKCQCQLVFIFMGSRTQ